MRYIALCLISLGYIALCGCNDVGGILTPRRIEIDSGKKTPAVKADTFAIPEGIKVKAAVNGLNAPLSITEIMPQSFLIRRGEGDYDINLRVELQAPADTFAFRLDNVKLRTGTVSVNTKDVLLQDSIVPGSDKGAVRFRFFYTSVITNSVDTIISKDTTMVLKNKRQDSIRYWNYIITTNKQDPNKHDTAKVAVDTVITRDNSDTVQVQLHYTVTTNTVETVRRYGDVVPDITNQELVLPVVNARYNSAIKQIIMSVHLPQSKDPSVYKNLGGNNPDVLIIFTIPVPE